MKIYEKGNRIPVRAQQIWLILCAHAVLKPDGEYKDNPDYDGWSGWGSGIITYGDLAEQMGMDRKAAVTLAKHLGVIGFYCKKEGLPPLNIIAVNDQDGIPGKGKVQTRGVVQDQKDVWKLNWFSYRPPSIRVLREVYEEHFVLNS